MQRGGERHWRGRGGGRGGGRLAPGLRPVEEGTRISIADRLADFQRSEDTEISFGSDLSNHDRAVVHAECKKYGFKSKSYGQGTARAVTVTKQQGRGQRGSPVFDLPFKPASMQVLQQYLQMHPPSDAELAAAAAGGSCTGVAMASAADSATGRHKRKRAAVPGAAAMPAEQVLRKQQQHDERLQAADMQGLNRTRGGLPIAGFRQAITNAVADNQVLLISGETGCGKTTQVPQFLLEDSWRRGQGCRIFCTQPRRISAITVAERVAAERGEAIGESVGYTIRLESKGGPHSSLMFCTNGVLLRALTQGDGLEGITHVVVDEIHERDKFADFLLILLRDLLPQRPSLRVVLMSATLHVDMFSSYFGGCPVVTVPGFTHPVQDFYLEDILAAIGYTPPAEARDKEPAGSQAPPEAAAAEAQQAPPAERQAIEAAIMAAFLQGDDDSFDRLLDAVGAGMLGQDQDAPGWVNVAHGATGATALMAAAGKGRANEVTVLLANGAAPLLKSKDGGTARDWALRFGHGEVAELLAAHEAALTAGNAAADSALALSHYQASIDADEVDLNLLEALLEYICGEAAYSCADGSGGITNGAVLIFLPGWDEIIRLKDQLEKKPSWRSARYLILPLHSMVPAADQRRVFARPPQGARKLILATNIAETAVTIDDVTVVINSGRLKEKSYDPYTSVSTLQSAWISRASEVQRRGRAGRCQPGVAFHCYSQARSQAFPELQLPELRRSPLDELCLQVKLLEGQTSGTRVADFLAKAVEPPVDAAVKAAVALLEDIGALDPADEGLTLLGRHLAALPLPPRVGKMLLYGLLFGCLDPMLTVACFMAYRDPWVLPVEAGARRAATAIKASLTQGAGGGSDHLAAVKAFNGWVAARQTGRERAFAAQHFLNSATMQMVHGMRWQLLGELKTRSMCTGLAEASRHASDASLVRSVLACGFYPQLGRLLPQQGGPHSKGRATILTGKAEKARIHPGSVNSDLQAPKPVPGQPQPCPLVIFEELTRGEAALYIRQCTAVAPHPLLLVAARLDIAAQAEEPGPDGAEGSSAVADAEQQEQQPPKALLVADSWLQLSVPLEAVAAMACLRQRLATAFAERVQGEHVLPDHLQGAVAAISDVFRMEASSAASLDAQLGSSSGAQRPSSGRGAGGGAAPEHGRGRGGGRFGTAQQWTGQSARGASDPSAHRGRGRQGWQAVPPANGRGAPVATPQQPTGPQQPNMGHLTWQQREQMQRLQQPLKPQPRGRGRGPGRRLNGM